jgi:predicted esterase
LLKKQFTHSEIKCSINSLKKKFFFIIALLLSSFCEADDCLDLLGGKKINWIGLLKEHFAIAAFPPYSKLKKFDTTVYFPTNTHPLKDFPEIPSGSKAILISMTGSGAENVSGKNFMRGAKRMQQWGVAQLSFDYPYHGEGPRDEKYYDLELFRKMVFQVIKHYKKTGLPVFLQGHSYGALVIQDILFLSPELVDGVVITSPGGNVTPELLEKYLIEFPPGQQGVAMKGCNFKFDLESDKWSEGLDGKTGVAGQMLSNKSGATIKSLIPVSIIAGDQDPYSTPDMIEAFAKRFSNANYEILKGFGHVTVNEAPGIREKVPMDAVLNLVELKTGKKLNLSTEAAIRSDELFLYFLENSQGFKKYLQEIEGLNLNKTMRLYENKNTFAIDSLLKRWNEFYLIQLWKALKTSSIAQERALAMNPANEKFFVFNDFSEMSTKQKEDFKRALYNFPLSDLDSN